MGASGQRKRQSHQQQQQQQVRPRVKAVLLIFCLACLALVVLSRYRSRRQKPLVPGANKAIVSLSSTALRLDRELPLTLYSLINQSVEPRKIYLFLPRTEERAFRKETERWSKIYWHPKVEIHFVADEGPATKFLPVLRALVRQSEDHPSNLDQPVIIVDDDHYYARDLVHVLLDAHERHPDAAVGLRGWRIRKDLLWGVDLNQYWRHVIEAHKVDDDYRVGVLTANEGYLITPRLLIDPKVLPPYSVESASVYEANAPLLRLNSAPTAAHLVDDVWMSGNLAQTGHARFVVPLKPPSTPSIDITIPDAHTLERHMTEHAISRAEANDQTLQLFRQAFERENVWYAMSEHERKEEELNGRGGLLGPPPFASWSSRLKSAVGRFTTRRRLHIINAALEDML